ncbi:MAG: glucoamylase family protein [Pseudotabrizicola sp.]|uniref:GH36-type glycosyl hydrolase domain-containing protein n=1 Tax=Pseudotabrizicola sp. TaxID=2939647 RepID=UPI002ACE9E03|nr:glucoamylase family protein [Pseudotabrizicola sp.]MDZ7574154.1 glucoamylase family protein [Pseudotabrizicola sp.]
MQASMGVRFKAVPDVWDDSAPIRSDLFGTERLEHHAQSLAAAQLITTGKALRVQPLSRRVRENGDILLQAYRSCAQAVQSGQVIAPAAEWLLDNFHLVEQQLRQIHDDLPPGYYRQLPKLAEGPFAGYPRVFGLTWAYVAHTDSLMSGPILARYVKAYQHVQPLMIGELWAVAITLRIVLIENMRRLALQIVEGHSKRLQADAMVDAALSASQTHGETALSVMQRVVAPYESRALPEIVAGQIAKRLRGLDPLQTPLLGWLEDRLTRQGTSVDEVIANTQARLGASNVTMRNIVTSIRLASEMDWADFFEDVSLVDARLRDNPTYAAMDFATRNRYRTEIEILAHNAPLTEGEVADTALALAGKGEDEHRRDAGYWLIGEGRRELETAIRFRPPARLSLFRRVGRWGLGGYLGAIVLVAVVIFIPPLAEMATAGVGPLGVLALAMVGFWLAVDLATAIVNTLITRTVSPRPLPGFDLSTGIPLHLRTLVAVPVLLRNTDDIAEQIERLEVHHLSSAGGAVHYALLSDAPDSVTEVASEDTALVTAASDAIAHLNARYPSEGSDRFFFLHRRRLWNPSEGVWMGWERKRGKLTELNRLLRGATDTSYSVVSSPLPGDVRYVITLDADTRLLRGTVAQLVGKIAHPMNRARFDATQHAVTGGYGILQPRVSPSLPTGPDGSIYQQLFSSPGGIEPYAAATSDVYQDLFGEGTFTGKGIYDVDAFDAALDGRVPENTLLSHDLFEGTFARAALVSDIEVVEDYPARYDVDIRRQHRWARGDWQLLPWIFGRHRHDRGGVPAISRWKMIDNLRRSMLAPLALLSLVAGWMLPLPLAALWTALTVSMLALPRLLSLPFDFFPARSGITLSSHFAALRADALTAVGQIAVSLALLANTAATMMDAVLRTAWRLLVSRRYLLEWMTAAKANSHARPTLMQQYLSMLPGLVLGVGACVLAWVLNPEVWPLPLMFGLIWAAAPALARVISLPRLPLPIASLSKVQAQELRLIARRTWRYFETFVTPEENFLPPDNFQETPRPAIATRTSPTNIGLYLLSTVAAHDMGWIGQQTALQRMLDTLQTMQRMPRFRGHLYNWHDTRDLRVLDPAYVSSVDSGNLAGHLIAVAQSCRAWAAQPVREDGAVRQAMGDCAILVRRSLGRDADQLDLIRTLTAIAAAAADPATPLATLTAQMGNAVRLSGDTPSEAKFWTLAMQSTLADHLSDQTGSGDTQLLRDVESLCRSLALEMDFTFLLDPDRKLLSIGFSVATNRLDTNCYDLLASEARLASLFAIAKGDVATRHWFHLGRPTTPIGSAAALISWSGSMFEYLMPSLVMRAPAGSVLEQTTRLVVARQRSYAAGLSIPWGISESSYNARDLEMTYQYSNFGVPGLGLKRGLSENRVIAPYATALAAMIDPVAAAQNYAVLADIGAEGRYGFYEAVDFTPSRLQSGETRSIVRSFMAHHQGMTITAIANILQNGRLRDRFHAEPMIQGAELLLQERVPRDVASAPPRATEVLVAPVENHDTPAVRAYESPATDAPTAHLLSNGNYGVMLTATGEGFSRWRDMAITRWRPEAAQAAHGSFLFLRDTASGEVWSAGVQPTRAKTDSHRAVFCEHHAAFTHHMPQLTTLTEVVVSAEDDAEARRVTLTNSGRRAREIDVTSYAELVLAPPAADQAHPAFSKMFVVTDFLPELGVVIATRRRRSPSDPEVWAAHIAVVEGEDTAPIQIETDRAKFIGRGHDIASAAMMDQPLSGTTGTVLDPIFSIRRRISIPAGGTTRVTFWTMVADTPDALLDLVDRHRDPSAFARAATLAWTQAQVQLRHLGITHADAADFQTLGGMLIRNDARLRASPAQIIAGAAPQSALWALSISGDLPIVLLRIDDSADISVLHQAISAHEYWQMHQHAVDLVVLNDRTSSYVQDLQIAIDSAVRAARSRPRAIGIHAPVNGTIHALRADLLNPGAREHLVSVARAVLVASRGDLASQLSRLSPLPVPVPVPVPMAASLTAPSPSSPPPELPQLEFFNGIGGFGLDGREYVTILQGGRTTPAPWINVVANPSFGFQVSAEGNGHVWSENSRENQITPWSNDPVTDPSGEAIYLHDLESGQVWTPTALPIRGPDTYIARHGFGYSRFQHNAHDIAADMTQFVPLDAPAKITRLHLRNNGTTTRTLAVTAYAEWVLGTSRGASAPYILTRIDPATGAILAQNTFSTAFPGRVAFADFGAGVSSLTADRAEFIGTGGSHAAPAGIHNAPLSGKTGPALDPCAALQRRVTLRPGETVSLTFLIGQTDSDTTASALIQRLRLVDSDDLLSAVKDHWSGLLGSVQIRSPDRAMDILLNGWLMYQTLACRIWARAGFYQASGAYGFRDQLQDGMALTFARPEMTRAHLLRAAARQFPEGDVQHWWLPHSGQGVRTRISDDRVWLGYGVTRYIAVSGDTSILNEEVPFLQGPQVPPGAHDDFFQPQVSEDTASLFEHCARGLDQAIALTGQNGMPLIGTGDWNDGMNRVGEGGKGTSVWLGWLLIATIDLMAPLADARDPGRAKRWRTHARSVLDAIEKDGWDGEWYRRGTFDDGTLLGSASSDECRIDSIAQSWAVLSGAADPVRARTAMASMTTHLIRPDPGLALLFAPPFDRTPLDPGYIKGYPPGLRENGGQYSHAAMWAILAHAKLGDGDAAHELFAMLNPINHALTRPDADRYKVEPYVVAADVYSTPPHTGRGGWTWYTGSAGWMYRAGIEGIVGLTRNGGTLCLNPSLPKFWPELTVNITLDAAHYAVSIHNPDGCGAGIRSADLNGTELTVAENGLIIALQDGKHRLNIVLGRRDA